MNINEDIVKKRLENLYKVLIIDRKSGLQSWHDSYVKISKSVEKKSKEKSRLDKVSDKNFFRDLIFSRDN